MAALPGDPTTHKANVQSATVTWQTAMVGVTTQAAAYIRPVCSSSSRACG
jgi:hypothetical protein